MALADPIASDEPLYAARLSPHRSLSRRGFGFLMAFTGVASAIWSLPFFLAHAWPIVGFLGLDVFGVWLAFRLSYAQARAHEDLRVTPYEVSLAKVSAKGERREWRFNPLWVRFEREEHPEFGLQKLAFAERARRVEFARFLGADQKAEVARDLSAALASARRGPRFA